MTCYIYCGYWPWDSISWFKAKLTPDLSFQHLFVSRPHFCLWYIRSSIQLMPIPQMSFIVHNSDSSLSYVKGCRSIKNGSVLILFLIGKVITGFSHTFSQPNSHTPFQLQHSLTYLFRITMGLVDHVRVMYGEAQTQCVDGGCQT